MVWPSLLLLVLQGPIDFDAKATAVGQLLERLSSQTGAHLRAAPAIAEEVVFVHAKGVSADELKVQIAGALTAEWTRDGDWDVLKRTPALEKQIWNAHVAHRRKLVEDALQETVKRSATAFDPKSLAQGLSQLGTPDEDRAAAQRQYQAQQALFARGPMARLLDKLILACSRDDLAAVGPFERRIFALNPTAMLRGFDRKKYADALAAFATEQQEWLDEASKVSFPPSLDGRMVSDPRAQLEISPRLGPVRLEVRRGEMTALFNVNLVVDGQIMTQTMFADPARRFLNAHATPQTQKADDPVVELSDDSKEFQQRMMEAFGNRRATPVSEPMKRLMLGVVTNDPLSWTVSDVLSAYAKIKNENLIAALPDETLSITAFVAREGPLRTGATMSALRDSGTIELRQEDNWALIVPVDRYEAAIDFTPRGSVAELMKSTLAEGRLNVRSYARYAFQSRRLNRGGIGDWFLAMYDSSVLGASDRTDWKSLQLYGSFSEVEQRAMDNGTRFAYTGMIPEQRKIVERIVYANRLASPTDFRAVEPTDAFPMGLPSSCAVAAKTNSTPVIVAYVKGSDGRTRPSRSLDPWNLGIIETEIVGNPVKMDQYGVADLAGYAPGADKIVQLRVEVAPNVFAQSSITVPDYDANATPVTWDQLPAPYPKQIADAIAQAKARKAGQPGKTIPPR